MEIQQYEFARDLHPVDVIEHVAHSNDWSFERTGDDEIAISVAGNWADYHVSFSWMEDFEALHLACAFDIKVPENRSTEIMRLLSLINEQMLFGHFDLWEQEGAIMFRQALLLSGGAEPTSKQIEVLLGSALEACECYYQAFQFVIWSGVPAREALNSVIFETFGTA
ncbi:MAG: YbjN domain-containing protein [Rhizobiaceae bacterium]